MRFSYVPEYLEGTTVLGGRPVRTEFVGEFELPEYPGEWCCDSFFELWGSHIVLTRREVESGLNIPPIIAIVGTELPEYGMRHCPFCGEGITLGREEAEGLNQTPNQTAKKEMN